MQEIPQHVHLVGAGGVMLSAIARVLLASGRKVSGSDINDSPRLTRIRGCGLDVRVGHSAANVPRRCGLVIASSAVPADNPELREARRRRIAVWGKGRALTALMRGRRRVGVAGTHGKTTTTAMLGLVLAGCGLDPTVLVGGEVDAFGGNVRPGCGPYFVVETDESDGSFLELCLDAAVLTNIDDDHLDRYESFRRLAQSFRQFLAGIPPGGVAAVWAEDRHLPAIARRSGVPVVTYGFGEDADLRAVNVSLLPASSSCTVTLRGRAAGDLALGVPGRHNVLNALAVAAYATHLGLPWAGISRALGDFAGVRRRLEKKGRAAGVTVVDDYGHHPAEVRATLEAARRAAGGRLICVFQPHRYTRTQNLGYEFAESFDLADELILMDIYPAGEPPLPGVSSRLILDAVNSCRRRPAVLEQVAGHDDAVESLARRLSPGDTVLTVGAGDVHRVGEDLLRKLSGPAAPGCRDTRPEATAAGRAERPPGPGGGSP